MLNVDQLNAASEALVRGMLEAADFTVEKLARSKKSRTADYLVRDARHRYLVEVTDRAPGHDYRAMLAKAEVEGVAELIRQPGPDRRFDDIMRDKAQQLRDTPVGVDFRVVWLTALNNDSMHIFESLHASLYGAVPVWTVDAALYSRDPIRAVQEHMSRICFYYNAPLLYEHADVHAVAFASNDAVSCLVNPFSTDVDAFRASSLVKAFRSRGGLCDPIEAESSSQAISLAPNMDRTDPSGRAQWEAVRDKYALLVQRPTECEWQALMTIRVPRT